MYGLFIYFQLFVYHLTPNECEITKGMHDLSIKGNVKGESKARQSSSKKKYEANVLLS